MGQTCPDEVDAVTTAGIEVDLAGAVAVVIGGTSGIGRAVAEALQDGGAAVVPTGRTEATVRDAAAAVGCDLVCPTDVTDRSSVRHLFERTRDEIGPIDFLVNSAGLVPAAKPVGEIADEEWSATLRTNLYGVFVASQIVPEYMSNRDPAIINVGSMNAEVAIEGLAAYVASKFGVKGLTKTLALEYADDGIRVNAIAPGYVVTRQNEEALADEDVRAAIHRRTPLSRFATLEEIAGATLFLCSPAAGFMTGETVVVDGGFSLK